MLRIIIFLTFFAFISTLYPCQALSSSDHESLARDPIWEKLLHFKGDRSEVISEEFFLSTSGSKSLVDELDATIRAFSLPASSSEIHALCRFPARRIFIEERIKYKFQDVDCREYSLWKTKMAADSISLLFATGYLENPASYYGHILLKFNKSSTADKINLLDSSLNFGAIGTDEDSIIQYIAKGLLGGYKSSFSDQMFYRHNLAYGETQLRDIWEYQLQLSSEQIDLLLAHVWELLPQKFTYYFLKQNCAYRMAELLELVVDRELVSKSYPFAIPYGVFDKLSEQSDGDKLVSSINYIPSRQRKLSLKMDEISSQQRSVVKKLIQNDFSITDSNYGQLSYEEKASVLEILLDYYQFLGAKNEDPNFSLDTKNRVNRERLRLKPSIVNWSLKVGKPPHAGVKPSMMRFSITHQGDKDGFLVKYRPAYYDFLTPDYSRLPNSKLVAFELGLKYMAGKATLDSVDLLDIHTLNTGYSGLPGDGGIAWKLNAAYKNLAMGCVKCKTSQATFGAGYALNPSFLTTYSMINARFHNSRENSGYYSAQIEFGAIVDFGASFRLNIVAAKNYYNEETVLDGALLKLEMRFLDSKDKDVRLSYFKEQSEVFEVSYSHYF